MKAAWAECQALTCQGPLIWAIDRYLKMRGYGKQRVEVLRSGRRDEDVFLGNLGAAYYQLGEVEQAISYYEQALAISVEIGHRRGQSSTLGNLEAAYYQLGQVGQAISYYEQALAISVEIGHRHGQGTHLGNLGLAYFQLGEVEQARNYLQQAFTIFSEIKSPNAVLVQQWLEDLDQAS